MENSLLAERVERQRFRPGNGVIAVILTILTAILLTVTEPAIGITWDEPAYISSSESYMGWFNVLLRQPVRAFQQSTIDHYWYATHEHPPVDRVWSGLVWAASRHFLDDETAHRLGNILLVAGLVAVLYLLVARAYGKAAGLFAAAALMLMPRFFFHAHLAALDVPVAAGIFFVTCLFWWTIDRRQWWWGLVLGIAWGLTEGIKLNATFLPIGLFLWFLLFKRRWYLVLRFLLMGVGAVITFLAFWPWLYHDTWSRLIAYFNFHFHHYDIGVWYFGQYWVRPPWPYVFVILWAVVPLTVLLLALTGIARARRGRQDGGLGWLLIISALVPMLVLAFGRTLVYDGERLFMPTFPFIAALAGAGFGWVLAGLKKWLRQHSRAALFSPAALVLGVVLLLPQTITGIRLYPHLLSYYSEGVGGLPGANRMQLETTYWCESYKAALPYINVNAKPGDSVWVEPWSYDVMIYYQLQGKLRSDIRILQPTSDSVSIFGSAAPQPFLGQYSDADWIILEYRQTQFTQMGVARIIQYVKKLAPPVMDVGYQGIPIMQLYKR
jgi:4-amino-4-deoxy-L-arabinose transferase-like glycosyltransferase